jgi:magnesium transporter
VTKWVDLLDPDESAIREAVPRDVVDGVVDELARRPSEEQLPRPTLQAHGSYVWGMFLAAAVDRDRGVVYYQEVDVVLTHELVVTVRKTPARGGHAFSASHLEEVCARGDPHAGRILYSLVDEVAERYLDLLDDLNAEIDEVEDQIETRPAEEVRRRLSDLRHDLLRIRRTLAPTRDAVRAVADDRIELEERHLLSIGRQKLFPREVDLEFFGAYDKILRAYEGLELSRDLVAGARDYLQTKIANDQNEVMKRLTAIASILLVPTFIVGLYGQNFDHMPELHWRLGYAFSWALIVAATAAQLVYFRRRRWL